MLDKHNTNNKITIECNREYNVLSYIHQMLHRQGYESLVVVSKGRHTFDQSTHQFPIQTNKQKNSIKTTSLLHK